MKRVELTDGVYWVGAIDWNIRDFHGHATPRGTTYNAYLIVDEKIALIDTVKKDFFREMLQRISDIVDPARIDYVVSNHVEMDHSSALPEVMKVAQKAQVVATARGKAGLTKYYGGEWPFIIAKTGDTISLGKRSLTFIEAPMLHWPDSMFTYLKEKHLLLPNDAFGQHLATSKRFDDEVEESVLMDEAATYYANILMPLAPLILRKVDEVKKMSIAIDMIAPSHGVIWRSNPQKIVDAYVKWSQGQAGDKVTVVYDTMWGSTDTMAKAIVEGIISEGVETKLFHVRRTEWAEILKETLDSKALLVGTPTLNNNLFPPIGGFLSYMRGLKPIKKIGAAFGSYGWGRGGVRAVNEELKKAGVEVLEPGLEVNYAPSEAEVKQCMDFGRDIARRISGGPR